LRPVEPGAEGCHAARQRLDLAHAAQASVSALVKVARRIDPFEPRFFGFITRILVSPKSATSASR